MDTKMTIINAVFAVVILGLAGCSTTSGNLCSAGPIVLDPGATERLTTSEKAQIVTLNKSGIKICGWRALQ